MDSCANSLILHEKHNVFRYLILFFICSFVSYNLFSSNSYEDFNLINLKEIKPKLYFNILYATDKNIVNKKIYNNYIPLLHKDAALALAKVNRTLKDKGYSLLLYDAFRPIKANEVLYNSVPLTIKHYFSNPMTGSNHSRGTAVDVTLVDKNGYLMKMPGSYDECNEKSSIFYYGGNLESRTNRNLLISEMEKEGFKVNINEWWHFNYIGKKCNIEQYKKKYPIINYSFDL